MQASLNTTDRRISLASQKSTSPEASVALPPSPISSEEPSSKPSPKPFIKPSSKSFSNIPAAIQLLKDRKQGILEEDWNIIQLGPGDYDELWRQLEREDVDLLRFIENKVHLDYNPRTFEFVVRMPTSIHEFIGESIAYDVCRQIDIIRGGNNPAAEIARKVHCLGSTSIYLEDGARRDPDKEFRYEGAKYPSLVIEIAYSQRRKNLSKLADQYIVESSGQIRIVIGIQLDYKESKIAIVSVWCPIYRADDRGRFLDSEEILSEEFRKADGTGVLDKKLRLQLKHFVPSEIEAELGGLAQEILIPYEKLAIFVDKAQDLESTENITYMPPAGIRKRRRQSTPPEEFISEDERVYRRRETIEARRVEEQDEEWIEE
ncbi:hypothetical protein MMC26_000595 [Xylographa opegraphella]|nr:hypothetical protein [Xylographa opegraphella]